MQSGSSVRPKLEGEGFIPRLSYYVRRALLNMRQNLLLSVVTTATVAISLLLFSLFLLVYVNVEDAADQWSEKVQVTVYFDREPVPAELLAIRSRVQQLPGTAAATFVSRNEALSRFRVRLKGQESLLEGIVPDVLPSSLEIRLKRSARTPEAMQAYVASLKKIPGVSEVQYGEEWVKRFNTFMNFLRLVGAVLGLFLAVGVIFIVSNTIRLAVYSRREELEVMAMVGATRFFMKMPFILEGIIQGVAGGIVALAALGGSYLLFLNNAGNFLSLNLGQLGISFLPPAYAVSIVGAGFVVGFLGSVTSLRRFINELL